MQNFAVEKVQLYKLKLLKIYFKIKTQNTLFLGYNPPIYNKKNFGNKKLTEMRVFSFSRVKLVWPLILTTR